MSYNGWANKETWLVNLWLGDSFDVMGDSAQGVDADSIESMVQELIDEQVDQYGFVRDLMNCAFGEINFHEIASHYEGESEDA